MDQAKLGAEALSAGNYAEAIKLYTAALAVSPTSPDYLIKRSTAYQRTSPADYQSALADADKAVLSAQKRGKRELIVQGQFRRAIALFGLERYPDCRFLLDVVKRMDPKDKSIPMWESKVNTKISAMEGSTDVTVKETPEEKEDTTVASPPKKADTTPTTTSTPAQPHAVTQTPADKIRHDWYQNNDKVYFTLLAKGVPKDKAIIDIQTRSLSISFPLQSSSDFDFSLEPLFAEIDPSASTFSIMSTKVEVVLKKSQPGQKWSALESNEPVANKSTTTASVPSSILQPATTQKAPSYPTSSRSGPKNWDKLASEALAKPKTGDSKSDGKIEEEEEDEGGDAVNGFFKKLYAGADADTRRAMMKSFSESNGTALSTNWEEVKKAKVETNPPDGLEAKKW
ncbi:SGS-domain-containing protein [Aureobasidium pullulans]|nr:SGS-domain-containing protein [Aureobasidium pullulans]